MDGMGNTNNSNITSSNCNTSTTTPPDATAAENTNIPNNMSGMSMMDMDPVYTQTMLTTTLIATAISFYLLYYVWKKRSYIPKEIMEDKGHRAVYFGAPLLFSLSCLLSIPITSYPFVNSPSSSFIELVNVTYSLIMPLFHVSIGMFCYQCVLR